MIIMADTTTDKKNELFSWQVLVLAAASEEEEQEARDEPETN